MARFFWLTVSGDWSAGADWLSGATPRSADDAVINNSHAVALNEAAVAHSLAANTSTLAEGGASTLKASAAMRPATP